MSCFFKLTVAPSIADRAFPRILARLRSGNQRQFGVASTPEGFRWMWNTFGSNEAKKKTDNAWIRHVKSVYSEKVKGNPNFKYKDALKIARKTYNQ